MIALDRSAEPAELTQARERRLARLRLDWLAAGIDADDLDAVAGFVDAHKSHLDGDYGIARSALLEAQHGKCAYCEHKLAPSDPIDHHRPRLPERVGRRSAGAVVHPGYFWLIWSLDNLLVACSTCNRSKDNRYPIDGPRARPWTLPTDDERSRWVDPLREDPSEHFTFRRDPRLGKWVIVGLTRRGRAMASDFKFERHEENWRDHIEDVAEQVEALHDDRASGLDVTQKWLRLVARLLRPGGRYRALTRAWLADHFASLARRDPAFTAPALPPLTRSTPPPPPAPLWPDRPELADLADLQEPLALWIRALGSRPHVPQLREALCAFAAAGPWPFTALAPLFPVDADTLRIQLEALARAGRLGFDGTTVTASTDIPPRR